MTCSLLQGCTIYLCFCKPRLCTKYFLWKYTILNKFMDKTNQYNIPNLRNKWDYGYGSCALPTFRNWRWRLIIVTLSKIRSHYIYHVIFWQYFLYDNKFEFFSANLLSRFGPFLHLWLLWYKGDLCKVPAVHTLI